MQRDAGQIACGLCGDTAIDRALMAPGVATGTTTGEEPGQLRSDERSPLEQLRAHVEANSQYVGLRFADEARAMHEGRSDHRAIYGEARPEEARALIEDGVPVAPLPFIPRNRSN